MDEEIYINVKQEKSSTTRSSTSEKETCHHQTEKRTHCCILLLGILCLLLLFFLIVLAAHRVNCPSGWGMFKCDCYLVSNESKSWRNAQDDCRSRGARLVVVDSTEEQTFLSGLTEQWSMLWIALTDTTEEGSWKWVSGATLTISLVILIIATAGFNIVILASVFTGRLSPVRSFDKSPVASLGENKLLSCYLNIDQTTSLTQVSVTWTKSGVTGVVCEFKNGVTNFEDQSSQFKGRAALFPEELLVGNASLLLSAVRSEDQGQYTCTISSSTGGGTVSVDLRTGAFSAPSFTLSKETLTAVSEQWFPEPNVTWTDNSGTVLNGNTSLVSNNAGIYRVETLLSPVNMSDTYVLKIENGLKIAISQATITVSGVTQYTYFYNTNQASTPLHLSMQLTFMIVILFNGLTITP